MLHHSRCGGTLAAFHRSSYVPNFPRCVVLRSAEDIWLCSSNRETVPAFRPPGRRNIDQSTHGLGVSLVPIQNTSKKLLGWSPSLLALVGWRPSLVGWRPLLVTRSYTPMSLQLPEMPEPSNPDSPECWNLGSPCGKSSHLPVVHQIGLKGSMEMT